MCDSRNQILIFYKSIFWKWLLFIVQVRLYRDTHKIVNLEDNIEASVKTVFWKFHKENGFTWA